MNYVIFDTETGKRCGKVYQRLSRARAQAIRLNKSATWGRFRVMEWSGVGEKGECK